MLMSSLKLPKWLLLMSFHFLTWQFPVNVRAQQTNIVLEQGPIVGLKIFPDSSRSAVFAFLGVPYAQPPIGQRRFATPLPHTGWNGTLQAMSMKAFCPQSSNTIYDETTEGTLLRPPLIAEDCLYLNIWVPEASSHFGTLPVLVIITGEEMAFDWLRNRITGVDIAAEDVVVVSIQYRSNIFGWIALSDDTMSGNFGLQDQRLALRWIQHNIKHFGGNPNQVTLLGHGTSGAPCALTHALSMANEGEQYLTRLILMSGGDMESGVNSKSATIAATKVLVRKLSCQYEEPHHQLVRCLRMKSVSDLLHAFDSIYDHGNGTLRVGPALNLKLSSLLTNQTLLRFMPPILLGITTNEGAFLEERWLDLAREGQQALSGYINYTLIPNILQKLTPNLTAVSRNKIAYLLNWYYFNGNINNNVVFLLNAIQRLISEANYEMPFYRILELLSQGGDGNSIPLYAYIFDATNSMDIRGKVNLFGGASHTSDLPLLLGPSLFQQISRRRFTIEEERLSRKIRSTLINYVKTGNPTPGRTYDGWLSYMKQRRFIFNLGSTNPKVFQVTNFEVSTELKQNLLEIENLLQVEKQKFSEYGPYHMTPSTITTDRNKKSYATNQMDSAYAIHLERVYSFWHALLPQIADFVGEEGIDEYNSALGRRVQLIEATADATRYRRGFFIMLSLVAVLLGILGLCVYLLRKDSFHSPRQNSQFCL